MATVNSAINIQVNANAFNSFAKAYQAHMKQVNQNGTAWRTLTNQLSRQKNTMGQMVQAMFVYNQLMGKAIGQQGQVSNQAQRTATAWQTISRSATSVWTTLKSIAKWTSIGVAGAGLLGFGSLFGLRGLAGDVASGRRTSLGLGMSFGAQRAFGINFQRFVNSGEFLGGINEAILDPSKRAALYMRGISEPEIRKGDTEAISIKVLQDIKRLVDRYPVQLLGTLVQSQRLGDLGLDAAALRRIKSTPASELGEAIARQNRDTRDLAVGQDAQKRWQDFYYQLDRAGKKIETAFIFGLDPLIQPLDELSDALADTVSSLMKGDTIKDLIGDVKEGLSSFTEYVKSGKLQENVKMFIDDVGALASAIHWLISFFPWLKSQAHSDFMKTPPSFQVGSRLPFAGPDSLGIAGLKAPPGVSNSVTENIRGMMGGYSEANNVGNIRNTYGPGFRMYRSVDEGVRAMANLLLHGKYFQGHNDTIRQIERVYSPPNENDTHYLIKQMARRTGFGEDQSLGLATNPDRLAAIISDLTRQEGRRFVPKDVVIKILNNTGGNAIVSAANTAR